MLPRTVLLHLLRTIVCPEKPRFGILGCTALSGRHDGKTMKLFELVDRSAHDACKQHCRFLVSRYGIGHPRSCRRLGSFARPGDRAAASTAQRSHPPHVGWTYSVATPMSRVGDSAAYLLGTAEAEYGLRKEHDMTRVIIYHNDFGWRMGY